MNHIIISFLFSVLVTWAVVMADSASTTALAGEKSRSAPAGSELDSLGSNKAIAERAKAIDGENRVRVVQNRSVDRNLRFEFGISYDGVTGGDSYIKTNNLGYALDFHITPKVSIGGRYYDGLSKLTPEGERIFADANQRRTNGDNSLRPDLDTPLSSSIGILTVYPLYGKLNFFNLGISQFDLFVTGGYGTMKLTSGETPTWIAGGGVGIWWSQHFTSRFEVRYQEYQDVINTGTRDQAITAFSFGLGFLL
ncbi:MAG: outer membrane beta-barrel domain-containing protein [Bdellovibrionales bacterium]|nr:outer membrane beta-barrel domain-containing protein [Bdellovibrionales bacterium]